MAEMTLGQKQREFSLMLAALITYAYHEGYEISMGEVFRSDEQAEINSLGFSGREKLATMIENVFSTLARKLRNNGKGGGIPNSAHGNSLAADLRLFKDGVYLTNSEDYRFLGDKWKSLHRLNRWGGDFPGDGNHFSMEHGGVK